MKQVMHYLLVDKFFVTTVHLSVRTPTPSPNQKEFDCKRKANVVWKKMYRIQSVPCVCDHPLIKNLQGRPAKRMEKIGLINQEFSTCGHAEEYCNRGNALYRTDSYKKR